ncbi:DUF4145 domain-containing protein [Paenibacillus sp. OT2-17]|uniref:DUF4145 domain-containing protein n=1 Tax=Paenibacillus sp. OT2-17 TaxID=2691605 RepID=UPI0013559366|nr:DUF4145 domain-containing protein [Paenibacillus sp. OT2-17]MXO77847.1 DUF4145 domain-containing protein [Paenibacillus sp. OT2-17]
MNNNYRFRLRSDWEYMEEIPDECPVCHYSVSPIILAVYEMDRSYVTHYRIFCSCPRNECLESYIVSFIEESGYMGNVPDVSFTGFAPFTPQDEDFTDAVKSISTNFVRIYNQAKYAEDKNLDEICGLGYRKAFEFLIKDFLVHKYPDDTEEIKNNVKLKSLLDKYVEDSNVKFLAERTAWLGNDHAHYTKKWINKDVSDLKRLIKTSLYWISSEIELEHYRSEMG